MLNRPCASQNLIHDTYNILHQIFYQLVVASVVYFAAALMLQGQTQAVLLYHMLFSQ